MLKRRTFLSLGAPLLLPGAVWAAKPGTKLRGALIGAGAQGRGLLHQFLGQDVVMCAVCDCDRIRREDRARVVNDYYRGRPELGVAADVCRAVADWRKIVADKSIDFVVIATPDHWHAIITVACLRAGKDVYCEKPLTYSVEEAKLVMKTAAATRRIVQCGAMQRSGVEFRTACEIVRNGRIGRITHVDAFFGGPSRPHRDYENPAKAAEEGAPNPDCDFDMWCGPAPLVKYSDRLAPRGCHDFYPMFWRGDDYFGIGQCGDWGAHHLDIAQWGLDLDRSGPVKVVKSSIEPSKDPNSGGRRQRGVQLVCANGCVIRHAPYGGSNWGAVFYGTEGVVAVNRGVFGAWLGKGMDPLNPGTIKSLEAGTPDGGQKIAFWRIAAWNRPQDIIPGSDRSLLDAVNKSIKAFELKKAPVKLYRSPGHPADFVRSVLSRKEPCSPAETGARAAILCQLCNLSYRHDVGFDWDPVHNRFAGKGPDPSWLGRHPAGRKVTL